MEVILYMYSLYSMTICFALPLEQKKKVKRRKRSQKKQMVQERTPEALEEAWQVVSQDLRAASFQVDLCTSATHTQININRICQ